MLFTAFWSLFFYKKSIVKGDFIINKIKNILTKENKKKICSAFLALILIITTMSVGIISSFGETVSGQYIYRVIRNGIYISGFSSTSYDNSTTTLNIPSSIDGFKVTGINNSAFSDCKVLNTVTVPDTVKYIGISAFEGVTTLNNVTLSNNLTTIDDNAFYGCTNLKEINWPYSLLTIGEKAFYNCSSITNIMIPEYVKYVGASAYENCTNCSVINYYAANSANAKTGYQFTNVGKNVSTLTLNLGYNVIRIPYGMFRSNTKIKSVTFHDKVTEIAPLAFDSTGITSVIFPNTITSIGSSAFINLTSATVVNNSVAFGSNALYKTGTIYCNPNSTAETYAKNNSIASKNICGQVTGGVGSSRSTSAIKISWNKISNATGYKVYLYTYNSKTDTYEQTTSNTTTSTTYTFSGLKSGTIYKFKVKAYRNYYGANCYGTVCDTIKDTTTPVSVTLSSLSTGSDYVTAKYTSTTGSGYQIQYTSLSNDFSKGGATTTSTSTSKKITGLTTGKKYYVRIRAYNTCNSTNYYGAWSNIKSITCK